MGKILSVFIDELGDFGDYNHISPYYMVSMVLHDQDIDISKEIKGLDDKVRELGFPSHAIHTGPIIRRESIYKRYEDPEKRKSLLNALYHFARKIDIRYICPYVKRTECKTHKQLHEKLTKVISDKIAIHQDYFNSFDRIIVYYDNGQNELRKILTSAFKQLITEAEFRRVKPSDYKLFQVADLVCTWEELALKAEHKAFTVSERNMFDSERDFMKNRYKLISKKKLV